MTRPRQLALFGPQMVHLFRWDTGAVAVPPRGNRVGEKYRMGASVCVMCGALESFVTDWADCSSCPGVTQPAPPYALPGAEAQPETLPFAAEEMAA